METIYFLIFVGACAFVVVWATRKSRLDADRAKRQAAAQQKTLSEKLMPTASSRLLDKEKLWEARRKHATEGFGSGRPFVPKFEASAYTEYDGYSRRDRHHLTRKAKVAEEEHTRDTHIKHAVSQ